MTSTEYILTNRSPSNKLDVKKPLFSPDLMFSTNRSVYCFNRLDHLIDDSNHKLLNQILQFQIIEYSYAIFRITVTTHNNQRWYIWRRLSELENLKNQLITDFPDGYIPPLCSENLSDKNTIFQQSVTDKTVVVEIETPATMSYLRQCQIIISNWLCAIKENPQLANHSHVRALLGLPPYRFSDKFGKPFTNEQILKIQHEVEVEHEIRAWKGTSMCDFQFLDERVEAKNMYIDKGAGYNFKMSTGVAVCRLILMEIYE
eukprot:gene11857-24849_t